MEMLLRRLLLFLLLFLPTAIFAQTSTTGRIDEGPLAARPTVCTAGDYYVTIDTNPVVEYKCSTGNNWVAEATGGGGGSPPGAPVNSPQCNNLGTGFRACANNNAILYVSTTGNDANNGTSWDTAKLTIMAAVCALPGGNCSTSPKQAGAGTVTFATGVSCNANANFGCWIAGNGDSQYPNMTSATGGPTAWTIETTPLPLNFVCATMNTDGGTQNRPSCQVVGPAFTVGFGNYPLVWISGNSLGAFYMNGFSGTDGGSFTPSWGRIGIDSATAQIIGTPVVTQTVSFTIENTFSDNMTGGAMGAGRGPQLAIGNGFWMHLHDDGFSGNNGESCQITSIARTSNVTTVTTNNCDAGGVPTQCPFLIGDHVSIRDTTGDNSFNGTFTAATACGATNTFTFNQTGPNFSSSVGSNGIISSDRAFGIVCYSCQIEIARMHQEGNGIKFYSGPSSLLELNDVYMEGIGTETQPNLWISSILYGGGGLVDIGGVYQSDVPTLPSIINEGGPQVFVHSQTSNGTAMRGGSVIIGGNDAFNRTTGLIAAGQSGWLNNQYLEASTDISRRQAPLTTNNFANLAPQNPTAWVLGGSVTATGGKRDPFGGIGAIELDSTSGSQQPFIYDVTQTVNVGDTWYFGGWVRAASAAGFQVANAPFIFYIGTGNTCKFTQTQPQSVFVPFSGDTNWFWITGQCTVWSTSGSIAVGFGVSLSPTTPVQVYRPFVFTVPSATASGTEVADEINSLGFGPSTQAGAGDITFPADKKICMASGSATNEFCGYITHSNTANRTYTLPDASGALSITSTPGNVTGQVLTAQNGSAPSFLSPGIADGNSGAPVSTTPYTIQCDSGTTILDRAHLLRFQAGASVVTVPSSTATGCTGNFVFTVIDEAVSTLTFNKSGSDTFSVYNGGPAQTSQTSVVLTTGQYATFSQGTTNLWEVRIGGSPSGINTFFTRFFGLAPQDYGAKGDWHVYQANINGTSTLTCPSCLFTAADVGKTFEVVTSALNATPVTTVTGTIITFLTSTTVTLSVTPGTTVTGTRFGYGHNDNTPMQNWISAMCAAASGGVPTIIHGGYVPQGGYYITQPLVCNNTTSSGTVNNSSGASSNSGECGPNGSTNGLNLRCGIWILGDAFTSSYIYVATAGTFVWPTTSGTAQAGNACAFNITGWDSVTMNGIGIIFDGTAHNTTSVTGKVAGFCMQNTGHGNIYENWVQNFHNTTNNAIGILSYNEFESKYAHDASEGNDYNFVIDGDAGNLIEKISSEDMFYENPGFYSTATNIGQNLVIGDPIDARALNMTQLRFRDPHVLGSQLQDVDINNITTTQDDGIIFYGLRSSGGKAANLGLVVQGPGNPTLRIECHACTFASSTQTTQIDNLDPNSTIYFFGGDLLPTSVTTPINNAGTIFDYGMNTHSATVSGAGVFYSFQPSTAFGGWIGKGILNSTAFFANQGPQFATATPGAGWGTSASIAPCTTRTGYVNKFCFVITSGSATFSAAPTLTVTLPNALTSGATVCELNVHAITGAGGAIIFDETTLSSTAPVFTATTSTGAAFTPAASETYTVVGSCGP